MSQCAELEEIFERIAGIAYGDNKDTFAAITPYLLQRRLVAQYYIQNPNQETYEHLKSINEGIAKILYIF
jgi:hypothetical protein